jgi:hypothetical protein
MIQKPIISILIIAIFTLFINTFIFGLHLQNHIFPDAENYYMSAQFLFQDFRGHAYRPVLYAFITGLPLFFGASKELVFNWVILLNLFFWLCSIIFLFKIISNFVSLKKTFLLTIIFIFSISNLFFTFHFLTETLLTFIFLIIIFNFQKYLQTNEYRYLVFSIAILLFSVLIKPMTTYLAILGILFFIPFYLKNLKNKLNFLIYSSIFLIGIQLIGMKAQFGNFTISYIDKVTIHNYLLSKADCFKKGIEYQEINNPKAEYLLNLPPIEQKKIAEEDFKNQFINNKINIFKAYFDNLFTNTYSNSTAVYFLENKSNFKYFEPLKSIANKITKIYNVFFIVSFVIFGIWYIKNIKKHWNAIILICSFLTLYTILVSGISSNQGDRFHIVVYPLILILISFFIKNFKVKL